MNIIRCSITQTSYSCQLKQKICIFRSFLCMYLWTEQWPSSYAMCPQCETGSAPHTWLRRKLWGQVLPYLYESDIQDILMPQNYTEQQVQIRKKGKGKKNPALLHVFSGKSTFRLLCQQSGMCIVWSWVGLVGCCHQVWTEICIVYRRWVAQRFS